MVQGSNSWLQGWLQGWLPAQLPRGRELQNPAPLPSPAPHPGLTVPHSWWEHRAGAPGPHPAARGAARRAGLATWSARAVLTRRAGGLGSGTRPTPPHPLPRTMAGRQGRGAAGWSPNPGPHLLMSENCKGMAVWQPAPACVPFSMACTACVHGWVFSLSPALCSVQLRCRRQKTGGSMPETVGDGETGNRVGPWGKRRAGAEVP